MPPRRKDVPTSSRDRLLQSAKRLFAAKGYEQTATSAIAREARTSESQLMRCFGGKVGLLEALFDQAQSSLNTRIELDVEEPASHPETILSKLRTLDDALARDPDLATLFLFEGRRLRGHTSRARMSNGFLPFVELIRGLVRRGQAAKDIDTSLDARAVASAIMGATEAMIRDRVMARSSGGRPFPKREIHHTLVAMLTGFTHDDRVRSGRSGRRRGLRRA